YLVNRIIVFHRMPFSVEPEFLDSRSEICGFYDADSRPEPDVLLFIAHRWLESAGAVRIWQGSVFQVRNFFHLYPINKVGAIYQAVSHEWSLPLTNSLRTMQSRFLILSGSA
ncbi:hypothetical protein HKBW3S03_02205, partial [Candidatus Hakubella thermalkaliphila]